MGIFNGTLRKPQDVTVICAFMLFTGAGWANWRVLEYPVRGINSSPVAVEIQNIKNYRTNWIGRKLSNKIIRIFHLKIWTITDFSDWKMWPALSLNQASILASLKMDQASSSSPWYQFILLQLKWAVLYHKKSTHIIQVPSYFSDSVHSYHTPSTTADVILFKIFIS